MSDLYHTLCDFLNRGIRKSCGAARRVRLGTSSNPGVGPPLQGRKWRGYILRNCDLVLMRPFLLRLFVSPCAEVMRVLVSSRQFPLPSTETLKLSSGPHLSKCPIHFRIQEAVLVERTLSLPYKFSCELALKSPPCLRDFL